MRWSAPWAVNYGKTVFTTVLPELWLFALGALFIAVTLFLPRGIVGAWTDYVGWMRRRKPTRSPIRAGQATREEAETAEHFRAVAAETRATRHDAAAE